MKKVRMCLAVTFSLVLLLMSGFIPINDNSTDTQTFEISEVMSTDYDFVNPTTQEAEWTMDSEIHKHELDIDYGQPMTDDNFVSPAEKIPDIESIPVERILYIQSLSPPELISPGIFARNHYQSKLLLT